jgi:hypothetical protein
MFLLSSNINVEHDMLVTMTRRGCRPQGLDQDLQGPAPSRAIDTTWGCHSTVTRRR